MAGSLAQDVFSRLVRELVDRTVYHQGFHAVVDKWTWKELEASDRQDLSLWLKDPRHRVPTNLIWKAKTMKGGRQVGVLDVNGFQWVDWWDIGGILPFDFARMLSKGTGFRFRDRKVTLTPESYSEAFWILLARKKKGKWDPTKLVNRCNNRVRRLGTILGDLKKCGWMLRKDDRSDRWVFVNEDWEKLQIKCLEGKISPKLSEANEKTGRLYFIPKTDKSPIKGRPIQAQPKSKKPLAIVKKLKEFLAGKGIIVRSVEEMYRRMFEENPIGTSPYKWGRKFLTADVKSMFTNIPQDELLSSLEKY